MAQNWRNYIAYYVVPYIGQRSAQEVDGAVCDALYAKLLAEGRIKARPNKKPAKQPVHIRRVAPNGQVLECRPYRYDNLRCYRRHDSDDPLLGQPIQARKRSRRAAEADIPGNLLLAWNPRRSSTRTACCTGPGRTSLRGAG